jgi:xenotropic and polytropic retrovirus receptor 1
MLSFSNSVGTPMSTEEAQSEQVPVVEDVIAALERNGVSFIGSARSKVRKEAKPKTDVIRIDIQGTTPTLSFMNFWESLVNGLQKEGERGNGYHLNHMKIQRAEKMIRDALVELYKGLEHMKKYRYREWIDISIFFSK